MTDSSLKNKVAIVTGAGRGIGKAIAIAYAQAGAAVICAARTQAEIEETAYQITTNGGQALAVQTDVTDLSSVTRMVEATIRHFSGIDILVINAGSNYDRRTVEESEPDDWERTLAVNLTGAYYCAQAVIPHLKARGSGKIITIGSGLGHHGTVARSAYACSKAGLWMLTRVLAQELIADRISVNEIIPGPVETALNQNPQSLQASIPGYASEWTKKPEDVTSLALFLATQPDIGPTAQSYSLMRRDR